MDGYIKLGFAALLPVITALVLYLLDKHTGLGKIPYWIRQLIFGIVFGGLAIIGTEWGIPLNDAQVNCRDAAVLTAGLLFGGPAGIIAGVIGGVERWIAVAWGVGTFTRVACTVSTLLAGLYAAALRRFMFENKKPSWLLSLAIGVVMEVFHLTMVFITNMGTPEQAFAVVSACSVPLIVANGLSVMLAAMAVTVAAHENIGFRRENIRISQTVQRWLLMTVVVAFAMTTLFLFNFQSAISIKQRDTLLNLAIEEVTEDIKDASDAHMLTLTRQVRDDLEQHEMPLMALAAKYDVMDINLVDSRGIITDSLATDFIGFDMSSNAQSAAFMCLISGMKEYVQDYGPIAYDQTIWRKYAGVSTETGFLQIGYDAEHFQREIDNQVVNVTRNRHVGQTGFIIILNADFGIVSAPTGFPVSSAVTVDQETMPQPGETFTWTVLGEKSYCCYGMAEGYYIVSVYPAAEADQTRTIALYVNTFLEVLVFALLFAFIYLLIKKVVVNQIKSINRSLARITGGHLDEVINVRSNEEFASLSDDINTTVNTLKNYIAEASARIDKELEFAKNIQCSALPNVFPDRPDLNLYALMDTAKEVGGDFYDFYPTGRHRMHFLIADVSGKGIPAAMFMMRAKTELKNLSEAGLPIDEVFTHGNANLCEGNDAGMFVTAWQGSLDTKTGLVRFANAGHNPPLVCHADGTFEYLRSRAGFVLAGMEGVHYKMQELQLSPGDVLFLYTDGVTEATAASGELYGEDRLQAVLNAQAIGTVTMKELCDAVKADVDRFVGEADQFDDITMLAVRYVGPPPKKQIHFDEARLQDIPAVTEFVEGELEAAGCPLKAVMQINVAIDEIYSNIAKFAYPSAPGPVTVSLEFDRPNQPTEVSLVFTDAGIPYNPLVQEDPDITLSAEERKIGGLGVFMVKKTMDEVRYQYENDQNILTLVKRF